MGTKDRNAKYVPHCSYDNLIQIHNVATFESEYLTRMCPMFLLICELKVMDEALPCPNMGSIAVVVI